jgi:hypothetical protein
MSTLSLVENIRIQCSDGTVVVLDADMSPGDLSKGPGGTANIYGRIEDGKRFHFSMPAQMFNESWFSRLCDALAAHGEFRTTIHATLEIDEGFVIPASPSRSLDACGQLAKLGIRAKFGDFAKLKSGRDRFSVLKLADLRAAVGDAQAEEVASRMANHRDYDRDAETAKVLRWVLRGLSVGMAVRKAAVDREVAANAVQRRR